MHPPFYILAQRNGSLLHPTIQYHYADDNPRALVPHPAEHVLVLDYDPNTSAHPAVQSISPSICVTGLRIEEAPGAAAGRRSQPQRPHVHHRDDPHARQVGL
ncbi:hypothetical protein DFH09DRAFT_1122391, partial [Mycena vulgaris]